MLPHVDSNIGTEAVYYL